MCYFCYCWNSCQSSWSQIIGQIAFALLYLCTAQGIYIQYTQINAPRSKEELHRHPNCANVICLQSGIPSLYNAQMHTKTITCCIPHISNNLIIIMTHESNYTWVRLECASSCYTETHPQSHCTSICGKHNDRVIVKTTK